MTTDPINIKVKKLNPDAQLPIYATPGSACFDLHSTVYGLIPRLGSYSFGTGLAFEIPKDHVMLVFSRSGDGFKHGVRLSNCVGVIDSDYRGEVKVKLRADEELKIVCKGDRIAQGIVLPIPLVMFEEAEELSDTDRGENGFGSTGVI